VYRDRGDAESGHQGDGCGDGGLRAGGARLRRAALAPRTPKGRRATKAEVGHAAKAGLEAAPQVLRSFRLDDAQIKSKGNEAPTYKLGDVIDLNIFAIGERVKVTGTTKGRGFQGVVKRHGFGGGPNTHGNTKHRRPGSIGPGTDPSRVIKGKKMPGHYGAERHTQINLRVEKIDAERNLIYLRGAVAGPTNGIVLIRKQGR
jgi:large subunit ribosomal protein L3